MVGSSILEWHHSINPKQSFDFEGDMYGIWYYFGNDLDRFREASSVSEHDAPINHGKRAIA